MFSLDEGQNEGKGGLAFASGILAAIRLARHCNAKAVVMNSATKFDLPKIVTDYENLFSNLVGNGHGKADAVLLENIAKVGLRLNGQQE